MLFTCTIQFFLQPARKDNVISAADIKTLFGNIDDIRTIHKTVLESLERDAAEHKIAPGFLHMVRTDMEIQMQVMSSH